MPGDGGESNMFAGHDDEISFELPTEEESIRSFQQQEEAEGKEIGNPKNLKELQEALVANENFYDLQLLRSIRVLDIASYVDQLLRGTTKGRQNTMSDPARFLRGNKDCVPDFRGRGVREAFIVAFGAEIADLIASGVYKTSKSEPLRARVGDALK